MTEKKRQNRPITKSEADAILRALRNAMNSEGKTRFRKALRSTVVTEVPTDVITTSRSHRGTRFFVGGTQHEIPSKDLQNQIDVLHSRIVKNENRIIELESSVQAYTTMCNCQNETIEELLNYVSGLARSKELKSKSFNRFFPVSVYLSGYDADTEYQVNSMLLNLYDSLNAIDVWSSPIELSSFFGKWFVKTKDAIPQGELEKRLKKLESAAEKKWLGEPQAKIDNDTAMAVKALMEAIKDQPCAIVRAGSLFIIKAGDKVVINNLNDEQIDLYESNPELWTEPMQLIEALKQQKENCNSVPKIGSKRASH